MDRKTLLSELNLHTFIAFDFETTGLDPGRDRIIEIAAIKFEEGEPRDRYVTLVNPEMSIPSFITGITGISNDMVVDAPKEEQIVESFLKFIGNAPMVAHNTPFDVSFLNGLAERHGRALPERNYYDTLPLSRTFLFFQPTHNLSALSDFYGFSTEGAHRAEYDTENCGCAFVELVTEAASYRLELISRLVFLLKPFDVFNKALFIDLANALTRSGDLKNGLVTSGIKKPESKNLYIHQGSESIANINSEDVFGADGYLNKTFDGYEERTEQVKYAQFVENILFDEGGIGVAEAGTGLGKTMAYLFPSLKRALTDEDGGPVVISCYTKHLQDQLFNKDLPQLAKALNVGLQAAVLKGRNNYLCKSRLNWLIDGADKLLDGEEATTLLPLLVWLEWTQTGDMDECPGFMGHKIFRLKALVRSEQGFCTTSLCARHEGCFFGPLRRNVYHAHLLIVNHAMLISEAKTHIQSEGEATRFLPPHNSVVIDEGHNLLKAAYNQLTLILDKRALSVYLDRVDPDLAHSSRWNNMLKSLGQLQPEFLRMQETLSTEVGRCRSAVKDFFDQVVDQVIHHFDPRAKYSKKRIIDNLAETFGPMSAELETMNREFGEVLIAIQRLKDKLLSKDETKEEYPELHQLFDHGDATLQEALLLINRLTQEQKRGWVYWFDGIFRDLPGGKLNFILTIQGAPVDLAEDLTAGLFRRVDNCVVTSATLRTEESFEYFLRRTGLDSPEFDNKKVAVFDSPFHYEDQVSYYQYGGSDGQNPSLIAKVIYACHKYYGKRIMALFTSRDTLNKTMEELRRRPDGKNLPIFAQTKGSSRQGIVRGMHQNKNGILLGTNAFWEGVDLPGNLLEILIITKIPFDVPTEPVIKAYGQQLESQGENKFMHFAVPEAVIRFRQGFGRLIRTAYDEGIFIVMDDRIVNKRYGEIFSEAIPARMNVFYSVEDLVT